MFDRPQYCSVVSSPWIWFDIGQEGWVTDINAITRKICKFDTINVRFKLTIRLGEHIPVSYWDSLNHWAK
jgi:hypothetical protein